MNEGTKLVGQDIQDDNTLTLEWFKEILSADFAFSDKQWMKHRFWFLTMPGILFFTVAFYISERGTETPLRPS